MAVCENMYNFAAVFQIYVNKEQCCNKELSYQHCYHSRAKRALEASAMFILCCSIALYLHRFEKRRQNYTYFHKLPNFFVSFLYFQPEIRNFCDYHFISQFYIYHLCSVVHSSALWDVYADSGCANFIAHSSPYIPFLIIPTMILINEIYK